MDKRKEKSPEISAKKGKKTDEKQEIIVEKSIELSYDVLRIIFSNLVSKDLYNCALVCRLWKEVAMFELQHRGVVVGLGSINNLFSNNNPKEHINNKIINRPMLSFLNLTSKSSNLSSFFDSMPSTCLNISIHNYGLISNNNELENIRNKCSYLLLPEDPKVDIEVIAGTMRHLEQINRKSKIERNEELNGFNTDHIEPLLSESIKRLKHVKCVILLTTELFVNERKLVNIKSFKKNVKTLCGAVAKEIIVHKKNSLNEQTQIHCTWLMLLISGRNVRSWSTFLSQSDTKEEDIISKLTKLKNSVSLLKHSVGFMFACVARGSKWYNGTKNVESNIFKQIFPTVPLIGSFGNGEFGSQLDCPRGLHLQYSTAFMIVTYG